MRRTSSGSCTIAWPLSENITTMVKRSATSVSGLMRGTNRASYHSRPLAETSTRRVRNPAANGMPR